MTAGRFDDPALDAAPAVRVRVHPGLCVGTGECHRWARNVYPLDDAGCVEAQLMEVGSEDADDAWWGASSCPARAITVIGPPMQYWYDRLRLRRAIATRREQTADATAGTAFRQEPQDQGPLVMAIALRDGRCIRDDSGVRHDER